MKQEKPFIGIKDDRLWKSITSDLVTVGTLLGCVGIGVALSSAALQWIGGIIWILWLIGRVTSTDKNRMTIKQARDFLDKLEAGK